MRLTPIEKVLKQYEEYKKYNGSDKEIEKCLSNITSEQLIAQKQKQFEIDCMMIRNINKLVSNIIKDLENV